ncbi:MAG: QacE family quaternary ammonium compound efflux SMR transporter [Epsilonproteobacteria bacterium]|nr:MAG: QacE family quaternary ammonium compound efflux SMR transporter [Campylobacterota bacterium]
MHWIYLIFAILFEVAGTLSIKQASIGHTYFWSVVIVVCYALSFVLIYFAIQKLDIGTAYAIWAAVGTALVVLLGWLIFGENMNVMKISGVLFIIFGVVLLKLQTTV